MEYTLQKGGILSHVSTGHDVKGLHNLAITQSLRILQNVRENIFIIARI